MKLSLTSVQQSTAASASFFTRAAVLGGFALLASAGVATAQDLPSVLVKQVAPQAFAFIIENPAKEVVRMQVLSLNNNACLVSDATRQLSYGRKLIFQELPAGKYAVVLSVGRERYRYNVQVQVQNQTQTTISIDGLTAPEAPQAVASVAR